MRSKVVTRAIGYCACLLAGTACGSDTSTARDDIGQAGSTAVSRPLATTTGAAGSDAFGNFQSKPGGGAGATVVNPAGDADECAKASLNAMRTMPTILFVIDGSGSMCAPFGASTRWQALRSALMDQTNGLIYRLQHSVRFGMALYDGTIDVSLALGAGGSLGPSEACATAYFSAKAEGACPQLIEIMPTLGNAAAIDMMYPASELGGSTPTDQAMSHAVDQMLAMQTNDPDAVNDPLYIILATDGQPNDICKGGAGGDGMAQKRGVIDAVDRAAGANITTFVISTAGGDAALEAHLDEVAKHGNPADATAHTYAPTNPEELVTTLATLLGGAIGCTVALNGQVTPGQECRGSVKLNGAELPCCKREGAASICNDAPVDPADGWRLQDPRTIELTGLTCTNFLSSASVNLEASFPCDVFSPD